jgi:opacity protein-like surface antigen
MNTRLLLILLLQIAALPLFGQNTQASVTHENDDKSITFDVTQGYRRDTIRQHLKASHVGHIKRKFKDLSIYQTRFNATTSFNDWFAKAQVGYGHVFHGKAHLDAAGSPKLHASVPNGYTLNAELQVGKAFAITQDAYLAPLVGYSWEKERLHEKKYRISGHKMPFLKSKDTFHWTAPFVGLSAGYKIANVDLYGTYKFLFALQARDAIHFKHSGKERYTSKRPKGFGNAGMVGAGYNFAKNWTVKTEYELSSLHTKGGHLKAHCHKFGHHEKTKRISSEVRLCLDYAF